MKNKEYIDALNQLNPDENAKKRMLNHILSESNISKTEGKVIKMNKAKRNRFILTGAVAAAALFFTIGLPNLGTKDAGDVLYTKGDVVVRQVDEVPEIPSDPSAITAIFNEQEVFNMFKTVAFMGTVKDVKNLSLDFDGVVHYRAMAVIMVDKVYKGDLTTGETVNVMLPGPVDTGSVMGADFNITRAMKTGERGIFMPMVYQSDDVWEENGKELKMTEFARYAIIDTVRFAFMDTEEGLLFERNTFPAIKDASTLEEVEAYILEKVK